MFCRITLTGYNWRQLETQQVHILGLLQSRSAAVHATKIGTVTYLACAGTLSISAACCCR